VKRAPFVVLLALVGCPIGFTDDLVIWRFKHRAAYTLPQDDAAATRALFTVTTRDGVDIHGLWLPAPSPAPCTPAILYCQGQSGDLQDHYEQLKRIRDLGFHVLTVDYRGNGMSEGETTEEEHTYVDAEAAAAELRSRAPGQPILYYGESLGGAICTELALRARPVALHLDCTFASWDLVVRDATQLPVSSSHLTDVRYDTISKIGRIGVPLQIFHGTDDLLLRPAHAVTLYDAAANPKELWLVPGAEHGTDHIQQHPDYRARLVPFVQATCGP
jgi:pimeloyl-ACP methyl ester carboxylesterase